MGHHIIASDITSPKYKAVSGGLIETDKRKAGRILLYIVLSIFAICAILWGCNYTIYQTIFKTTPITTAATGYQLASEDRIFTFLVLMGLATLMSIMIVVVLKVIFPRFTQAMGAAFDFLLIMLFIGASTLILLPYSSSKIPFNDWAEQRYGVVFDNPIQTNTEGSIFTYDDMEKIGIIKNIDHQLFLYTKKTGGTEIPLKEVK